MSFVCSFEGSNYDVSSVSKVGDSKMPKLQPFKCRVKTM